MILTTLHLTGAKKNTDKKHAFFTKGSKARVRVRWPKLRMKFSK
jgi:hypothetical protein